MLRKYFTDEEMEILTQSKWVKKVSRANVTFTEAFKESVLEETKQKPLADILPKYDLDPKILGDDRIWNLKRRILEMDKRPERFGRKKGSGRSKIRFNNDEEEIDYLTEKLKNAQEEQKWLKERMERTFQTGISLEGRKLCMKQIQMTTEEKQNQLSISSMCHWLQINRSSYYAFLHSQSEKQQMKELQDQRDIEKIREIFEKEGIEKGARQIKMQLYDQYQITMNLKKIRRLMKKAKIVCTLRQSNPMKAAMRKFKTTHYKENILKRQFNQGQAKKVLLIDITYLHYAQKQKKAYFCAIKDATTKQILGWNLSESLELGLVLNTVHSLLREYGKELACDVLLHSDQGCHFTAYDYQALLQINQITQSMSRRGNCWDNAPEESFFSTFKCESGYERSKTLEDLIDCIGRYIGYYNLRRPQWNLNRMTPAAYDDYLSDKNRKKRYLPVLYRPEVIRLGMVQ